MFSHPNHPSLFSSSTEFISASHGAPPAISASNQCTSLIIVIRSQSTIPAPHTAPQNWKSPRVTAKPPCDYPPILPLHTMGERHPCQCSFKECRYNLRSRLFPSLYEQMWRAFHLSHSHHGGLDREQRIRLRLAVAPRERDRQQRRQLHDSMIPMGVILIQREDPITMIHSSFVRSSLPYSQITLRRVLGHVCGLCP